MVEIRVRRLDHAADLPLPAYATAHAAGADLRSAEPGPVEIAPGERCAVATGLVVEIPAGHEGQIRPRSGLALQHGVTVANAPGTVDADYRGEIRVILVNLGAETFTLERGQRMAQLIIAPVITASFVDSYRVAPTARGEGGFGSTGR